MVLPPQMLYLQTIRRARQITAELAKELDITGPFNVQFIAKNNVVKVIECNLRASRSLPFVSKVLGVNFAAEAMRCMLGVGSGVTCNSLDLDHVGVKAPMFSFGRLHGADPLPGVEMASTGEVGCIAGNVHEALLLSLLSTSFHVPSKGVLLSLGPTSEKFAFSDEAFVIRDELKLPIFATAGTADALLDLGIEATRVGKSPDDHNNPANLIASGQVDLIINIPRQYDKQGRPDGYWIRRAAIDQGVPLVTDLHLAKAVVEALRRTRYIDHAPLGMDEYVRTIAPSGAI
jgi:carbamoyl-phosphate synthase large subunit